MTCQELIDYFKKIYEVDINYVSSHDIGIVETYLPSKKSKLHKKIEDIYNEISDIKLLESEKYLLLTVSGKKNEEIVEFPTIKYIFKN